MSLLQKAHQIVHERSEEKERQYGPFEESMEKAACIATDILNKEITASDLCMCLVALKMARESYSHKEDNILDSLAYLEMYNQIKNK